MIAVAPPPPATGNVPAILLRYQSEAVTLSHANELFVVEKSRRTGVTYGFAADAVLIAAPANRPQNVYYIAFNTDMTREFIDYVAMFAKSFEGLALDASEFLFDDGSEKGIKALRVDFPSGKSVIALSSKPRSLRGRQGVVIVDEAAFHDDLKGVIDAANALTMWGGRIVVISTHNGTTNYFNQLVTDIRAGRREGYVYRLTLTEALEDGLYQRICLRNGEQWTPEKQVEWERKLRARTPEAAPQEFDVIPAEGSGNYLRRALVEACTSDESLVLRLTCPKGFERQHPDPKLNAALRAEYVKDWLDTHVRPVLKRMNPLRPSFFGQDFARNGDLSVVAAGQHDDHANLVVPFVIEMRNVPFREQKQVLDYLCDPVAGMPNFNNGKMDARGNGQNLAEDMQSDWGFDRIEAVTLEDVSALARELFTQPEMLAVVGPAK